MKRRDHFFLSFLFFFLSLISSVDDVANPRSSIYRCRSMTRWKDHRVGRRLGLIVASRGGKDGAGKTEKGGWEGGEGPTTIREMGENITRRTAALRRHASSPLPTVQKIERFLRT